MLTPDPVTLTVEYASPRTEQQIIERIQELFPWDVTQVRVCMLASFLPADTMVIENSDFGAVLAGDLRERRRNIHVCHPLEDALDVVIDELGLSVSEPLTEPGQVGECRAALKRVSEALWVAGIDVDLPSSEDDDPAAGRAAVLATVELLQDLIAGLQRDRAAEQRA